MIHAKTGDKTQKTKKKHRWIFFLLLLILFILAGVGYWFFGRPADDFYFDKQARDGLIKARTKEDVQKILDTVVEKGMFNASINPNPVFPDGNCSHSPFYMLREMAPRPGSACLRYPAGSFRPASTQKYHRTTFAA